MTNPEIYNAVYRLLRKAGVPPASKSNPVIAEAVVQYRKNQMAVHGQWTSVLLPAVGNVLNMKDCAVERLIVRAIDACFEYDGGETLCRLLNIPTLKIKARSFIITLSEVIE